MTFGDREPKQRKCRCGNMYLKMNSFQTGCLSCLVVRVTKARVTTEIKAAKAKRKEHIAWRKKVKDRDLGHQHDLTKVQFNRMRVMEEKLWFRERGIEPYCISCQHERMDWSCGHYKTVGHQGNLRYDRMNTFLQCSYACNKNLSGNINGNKKSIGYKAGLLLRFGNDEGQIIIDYCDTHTEIKKWTWQELKELRAECAANIRQLEHELRSGRAA